MRRWCAGNHLVEANDPPCLRPPCTWRGGYDACIHTFEQDLTAVTVGCAALWSLLPDKQVNIARECVLATQWCRGESHLLKRPPQNLPSVPTGTGLGIAVRTVPHTVALSCVFRAFQQQLLSPCSLMQLIIGMLGWFLFPNSAHLNSRFMSPSPWLSTRLCRFGCVRNRGQGY